MTARNDSGNIVFQIPKRSFTASQLRYSTLQDISRNLTTEVLGGVPESWILAKQTVLAKIPHRQRILSKIKGASDLAAESSDSFFNGTIHEISSDSSDSEPDDTDLTEAANGFSLRPTLSRRASRSSVSGASGQWAHSSMVNHQRNSFREESVGENNLKDDDAPQISGSDQAVANTELLVQNLYDKIYEGQQAKEQHFSKKSPFQKQFRDPTVDLSSDNLTTDYESALSTSTATTQLVEESQYKLNYEAPPPEVSKSPNSQPEISFSIPITHPNERSTSQKKNLNQIKKMVPGPARSEVVDAFSPLEASHFKAIKKLRKGFAHSRRRVKQELDAIEGRLRIKNILQKFQVGEVLKVEKLLVLVKESTNRSYNGCLTDNEETDTRVLERWKEYIMVVRSNSDPDFPVYVQFEKQRHIKKKDEVRLHGIDFWFGVGSAIVKYYNSLDKTICISIPNGKEKHGRLFYIIRTHTVSSANSWYGFFQDLLSHQYQNQLKLAIPALDLNLSIAFPYEFFEDDDESDENYEKALTIEYSSYGYEIRRPKGLEYVLSAVDGKISTTKSLAPKRDNWSKLRGSLNICWRDGNRLEWLPLDGNFGNSLLQSTSKTAVLELRTASHYPAMAVTEHGEQFWEPPPPEGFLARLTSRSGALKAGILRRSIFKFEYYFTQDNHLMFRSSRDAIPAVPDSTLVNLNGDVPNIENLRTVVRKLPQIYQNNKFALDSNGHLPWLKPGVAAKDFKKHDLAGLYEIGRRVSQALAAKGMLKLSQIAQVRSITPDELPHAVRAANRLVWDGTINNANDEELVDACFEIVLYSGARIRLLAPNKSLKMAWIYRLDCLAKYWKVREMNDIRLMSTFKVTTDPTLALLDNSYAKRESVAKMNSAISLIYNIDDISISRSILMSGTLYEKPKKHSVFTKYMALLMPGNLVLYKIFRRSSSGRVKKTTTYKHYLTIPIHEAYVYSGELSSMDLVQNKTELDQAHPTNLLQPKVFEDGLISCERERERCFTLWFGRKRAIAGEHHHSIAAIDHAHRQDGLPSSTVNNPGVVRVVSRLGVTGNNMVFITRSKEERDIWVSRISNTIEHFFAPEYEEIRVT